MSDYSQVVIERFCQARRFEYRLADGAREAVDPTSGLVTVATYFIAQLYAFFSESSDSLKLFVSHEFVSYF
jgi:hypothetical protein